jgi:Protein chain release factor B
LRGLFEVEKKEKEILELETIMNSDNFWSDVEKANNINQKLSNLKKELTLYYELNKKIVDNIEVINMMDDELLEIVIGEKDYIKDSLEKLEVDVILSKEFDRNNCYLEIHPGAGGTESCDWASMLYRMYLKYCDKNNFKYEIIDEQKGEEAGN